MPDAHRNFATGTVATAPSPATTGTSLVLTAGDDLLNATTPFNATVWPRNVEPTRTNAEIVRVTAIASQTLTITRAQEGTTARAIGVGDQIAQSITAKSLTDIEGNLARRVKPRTGDYWRPDAIGPSAVGKSSGFQEFVFIDLPWAMTFDRIGIFLSTVATTGTCRLGIYAADDDGYPTGLPILDAGTVGVSTGGNTAKEIAIDLTLPAGGYCYSTQTEHTGSPQYQCLQNSATSRNFPFGSVASINSNGQCVFQSHTGAFEVAPAASALSIGASAIYVWLRRSA